MAKKAQTSKANIEAEVGQIVAAEDIKHDLEQWMKSDGGTAQKMVLIWIDKEGVLRQFGTNMKAVEAIGYLEVAKADLLDYMYAPDEDEEE